MHIKNPLDAHKETPEPLNKRNINTAVFVLNCDLPSDYTQHCNTATLNCTQVLLQKYS